MSSQIYIDSLISKSRVAMEQVKHYSQEQADAMMKAVGKTIFDNKVKIGTMAWEETGMGELQMKIDKHNRTAMIYESTKGKPSVGIIERDEEHGIITIAKPMGVVAGITPSTNPTTCPSCYAMMCLKGLNALIIAPHPRAKKCGAYATQLMREALVRIGAPADLIQCIEEPTLELSGLLMESCDVIIATGGSAMVKAAYSKGKPCFGVGQGNVQTLVAEDYDDFDVLAENIIVSRAADYGMPCTGEQTIFVSERQRNSLVEAFAKQGCYVMDDQGTIQQMRERFFVNGEINRDIVGKIPKEAMAAVGLDIPETPVLIVILNSWGKNEPLAREIMFPILRVNVYSSYKEAVSIAEENLINEGAGHSADVYSNDEDAIVYTAGRLPVCRVLVSQPNSGAAGNRAINYLEPTNSVGCGTWGGNAISDNLAYYHLLNKTRIVYKRSDEPCPIEDVWND